jgi:hypothetical protein
MKSKLEKPCQQQYKLLKSAGFTLTHRNVGGLNKLYGWRRGSIEVWFREKEKPTINELIDLIIVNVRGREI